MDKIAIFQNGDAPQIESTAELFGHAGYQLKVIGPQLRIELINAGCDTVVPVQKMELMGYEKIDPRFGIEYATPHDMETCDLFLEIKCRNIQKIWNRWPRLEGRTGWIRVNGSQPEFCPTNGDEASLLCPIVTACLWYGVERYKRESPNDPPMFQDNLAQMDMANNPPPTTSLQQLHDFAAQAKENMHGYGMAYTHWPNYPSKDKFLAADRKGIVDFADPYNLCYYAHAWGYGEIVPKCRELGVKMYGSDDGQVQHTEVPALAANAKALVHLKAVDAPGWTLMEAMLSGCPVITGRMLNSRMLAYDLLRHGETCLEFGVHCTHEFGRGDTQQDKCYADIVDALETLSDPVENCRIGQAGRKRLLEVMWSPERDGDSFHEFAERWWK